MDPLGSSTTPAGPTAVPPPRADTGRAPASAPAGPAVPQATPLPSAPGARPAPRPAPAPDAAPPLPVAVQREQLQPPSPPLLTQEQMVALLRAAMGGPVSR